MPLLHSKIIGEGPPLLILHGFLGMSDNWKSLGSQYAASGLQVHLVDQRNHGKSFHSEHFNYGVLAQDIHAYIRHHELPPTVVLGHSMGGKTAMEFACAHPGSTKKLIVADIAPKFYPPHHQDIIKGLRTLDFDVIKTRAEADGQLGKHIKEIGVRQFLLKNLYWVEKERLGFRFNLDVLGQKMEEIGENIDASASYAGPALFLRGGRSEYVGEQDLPEIKKHFPLAILDTVDRAGHWLHAENPQQFFSKSMAFINA